MAFCYDPPPNSPQLRQCEILCNLFEVIPTTTKIDYIETIIKGEEVKDEDIETHIQSYPFVIVITQDCDIERDWEYREGTGLDSNRLAHFTFCELFQRDQIKNPKRINPKVWDWIQTNQHERYHHLDAATIGENDSDNLPNLYADFKHILSIPIEYVYALISKDYTIRKAILPYPYQLDFIHRLYNYLGRVPTD